MFYLTHCLFGKFDSSDYCFQAVIHKSNITGFNRNIASTSNGHAYMGCCQSRCIIDSISSHSNGFSRVLQLFHFVRLVFGQNFGQNVFFGNTNLFTNRPGSSAIITSDHIDFNAHIFQLFNCLDRIFFDCIGNSNQGFHLIIYGYQNYSFTFFFQFGCFIFFRIEFNFAIFEQFLSSNHNFLILHSTGDTFPGIGFKILRIRYIINKFTGFFDNCFSQWMF